MNSNSSKENQQKDTFLRYASVHLQEGLRKPRKIINNALYSLYSDLNMIKVQRVISENSKWSKQQEKKLEMVFRGRTHEEGLVQLAKEEVKEQFKSKLKLSEG